MNEPIIDSLTRRVATSASRRDSILALGGAGLATLAGFATVAAGKKNKRKKNRKKDKKCKKQVGQCNDIFAPLCAEEGAPEDCLEQTGACCEFLGQCQADEFVSCFFELIGRRPEEPPR